MLPARPLALLPRFRESTVKRHHLFREPGAGYRPTAAVHGGQTIQKSVIRHEVSLDRPANWKTARRVAAGGAQLRTRLTIAFGGDPVYVIGCAGVDKGHSGGMGVL